MTKYTSNEQYERDKAAIILAIGNVPIDEGRTIADLLKQSKWIGADEATTREKNVKKKTKGGFFWDDDDDDSTFWAV